MRELSTVRIDRTNILSVILLRIELAGIPRLRVIVLYTCVSSFQAYSCKHIVYTRCFYVSLCLRLDIGTLFATQTF